MRKFLSLFFILVILSVTAKVNAQIKIGARGGINFSSVSGGFVDYQKEQEFDASKRMGWQGGVYVDIPVISGFSIQPGVLYISKGSRFIKEKSQSKNTTRLNTETYKRYDVVETTYSLNDQQTANNFLEIPLLMCYKIALAQHFYIQAGVGPYAGYNISTSSKTIIESKKKVSPDRYGENKSDKKTTKISASDYADIDERSFGEKIDYGLAVLGKIGWKRFGIGIEYDMGLRDGNKSNENPKVDLSTYTRSCAVFLDFEF